MAYLNLHNTLTRKTEPVVPLDERGITIYTCGPTVYNTAHIGNLRAYVYEDVLVKTLRLTGIPVKRVMNITDVGHLVSDGDEGEDKLEVGARREGTTAWDIAAKYEKEFLDDLSLLNCELPDEIVRATDTIKDQIILIQELEKLGYTYRTGDGIYFDTGKLTDYGALAQLDTAGLQAGARVAFQEEKRNLTDFALWKFSPSDRTRDMEWDSPWGRGFPGWHIECSAIIRSTIGDTVDIHCGGIDHIPVHHVNEIAQSESVTGKPLARYWSHCEFLQVEGQKMSKSLNNAYTLKDLKERGFSPLAFRLLLYSASYRSKLNFTWEGLKGFQNKLDGLYDDVRTWKQEVGEKDEYAFPTDESAQRFQQIEAALLDDLNTPQVLAELWSVQGSDLNNEEKLAVVTTLDRVLSLGLSGLSAKEDIPVEVQKLFESRQQARLQKDWAQSDKLRVEIEKYGYKVEDTAEKSTLKAKKCLTNI